METWAHGLDCFAAAGRAPVDTDRLVHVAWLGWKTLPFAFATGGVAPPDDPARLRIELVAPSGAAWAFGPDPVAAAATVRGPASTWCRVVTHRLRPAAPDDLELDGALAVAAHAVARAYLA
jgi:uncharacterized protein (TIGR03084 family)